MSDPAEALQVAIFNRLRGATDAGANVYDEVKGDAALRITLGEGQTVGNFADCYDGSEVFLQIDVWSRAAGFREAKRVASQVRRLLDNAELALDGHRLELLEFQDANYSRDPDGRTRRARMTFRALTQALA